MKVLALTLLLATSVAAQSTKRLYIEERAVVRPNTSRIRDVSLEATKELRSKCPSISVTDNREAADYVLRLAQGNSVLYRQNGDVAYVSPAKLLSNAAKDVCQFIERQKP